MYVRNKHILATTNMYNMLSPFLHKFHSFHSLTKKCSTIVLRSLSNSSMKRKYYESIKIMSLQRISFTKPFQLPTELVKWEYVHKFTSQTIIFFLPASYTVHKKLEHLYFCEV